MTVGSGYSAKELAWQLKCIHLEHINAYKIEVWVKIHEPLKKQCSSKNSLAPDRESQLGFYYVNVRYDVYAFNYLFTAMRACKRAYIIARNEFGNVQYRSLAAMSKRSKLQFFKSI
jgi:hypothetical protein